jgi:hypothetical protein
VNTKRIREFLPTPLGLGVMLIYILGVVLGSLAPIHHWYEVLAMVAGWCFFSAVGTCFGLLAQRHRKTP